MNFRRHTSEKAAELGVRGWVLNTEGGQSVRGEAVGPRDKIQQLSQLTAHHSSPPHTTARTRTASPTPSLTPCVCVCPLCAHARGSRVWLTTEGSPGSRIESAEVDEMEATDEVRGRYTAFEIRRK